MQRKVLLILAAVVIAGSAYAHGVWTLRWTGTHELEAAASSVSQIPKEFGDWTSQDIEVSARTMDQAGALGHISRRYENKVTGQSVTVMLMCGLTGPLAAHLPTICLPNAGMNVATPEKLYTVKRDESRDWGQFAWAEFKGTQGGTIARTRLFWGWSADGSKWLAPGHPRVALAGYPYLFKIFVHRDLDPNESKVAKGGNLAEDPGVLFLLEFLPEVKKAARNGAKSEKSADKG